MDANALTALRKSIMHWRDNETGLIDNASVDGHDCALCCTFYDDDDFSCHGCPVCSVTGEHHCRGTPYKEARNAFVDWRRDRTPEHEAVWRGAARTEREFLESLLPTAQAPES